jgi:hypothetical protein
MSGSLTSSISSNVKYSCDSTATEDVASAIAVFDFYCSAARAEVTAGGITDSIAQTYPTAAAGNSGGSASGGAKPTNSKNGGAAGSGTSTPTGTPGAAVGGAGASDNGNGPKPAAIAGAVVGVVVGLLGLGILIWYLVKQSRKKQADAATLAAAHMNLYNNGPEDHGGKPELAGNPIAAMAPPSPSPSTLKPNGTGQVESVSPVSAHGGSAWAPPPNKPELHGQPAAYPPMPPNAAELAVQAQQGSPYALPPDRQELMGGQGYPLQELPSPNRPELMGQQGYPQGYQQGQTYPMQAQEYNGNGGPEQYPQEAHGQPIYEVPGQQGMHEGNSGPVNVGHQQQPHTGWPMAELDGRYGQAR